MVIDPNGQLVGLAPYVKDAGPHSHDWVAQGVGADGVTYSYCTVCNARTANASFLLRTVRLDWILGADWDAEPTPVVPATSEEVTAAIDEMNEAQRNPSPEHQAAMPSVPVLADPIQEQLDKAPEEQRKLDKQVRAEAELSDKRAAAETPAEAAAVTAEEPAPAEDEADATDEDDDAPAEAPRRRGRPRKNAE